MLHRSRAWLKRPGTFESANELERSLRWWRLAYNNSLAKSVEEEPAAAAAAEEEQVVYLLALMRQIKRRSAYFVGNVYIAITFCGIGA